MSRFMLHSASQTLGTLFAPLLGFLVVKQMPVDVEGDADGTVPHLRLNLFWVSTVIN